MRGGIFCGAKIRGFGEICKYFGQNCLKRGAGVAKLGQNAYLCGPKQRMMKEILKGIENIVFDFGCVLVDLDKDRCVKAWHEIGAGAIAQYVDECRQEDLFHELETGHITVDMFCDEVRHRAGDCDVKNEDIVWAWQQLLSGIPERRVQRLRKLKEQYRLFLLSNTNVIHWQQCRDHLAGCFEQEFLSFEMGLVKPDRAIFEQMLRQSGIDAKRTLFVDDSAANCQCAESLGIRTLHVADGDEWRFLAE